MKNFLSIALVAAPLVLLAPNNTAEAVSTLASMMTPSAVAQPIAIAPLGTITQQATENVTTASSLDNPDPTAAWLMALGFLGLVIVRRMRGQ